MHRQGHLLMRNTYWDKIRAKQTGGVSLVRACKRLTSNRKQWTSATTVARAPRWYPLLIQGSSGSRRMPAFLHLEGACNGKNRSLRSQLCRFVGSVRKNGAFDTSGLARVSAVRACSLNEPVICTPTAACGCQSEKQRKKKSPKKLSLRKGEKIPFSLPMLPLLRLDFRST